MAKLVAPKNLIINFQPSPKQYEVWKALMPECHLCGGKIEQVEYGKDPNGQPLYKPICSKCGNDNIPQSILCGGAAGGGKTFLAMSWLGMMCIKYEDVHCFIARLTIAAIYKSCVRTMKEVLKSWGLEEEVNYRINSQKNYMIFWNGSLIDFIELSQSSSDLEYSGLGSSEYTCGYFEEISEIPPKGYEVLTSRIRWKVAETTVVPKSLASTNPCLGYVKRRWVKDDDGNPAKLANGDLFIPFSIYDNPSASFRAAYLPNLLRIPDPVTKDRLLNGNWDWVESNDAAAYWGFDGAKQLISGLREKVYDSMRPLILSFDFNVAPYMSCLVCQIDWNNKKFYILEEILGLPSNKENNTPAMAKKIAKKYLTEGHVGGLVITGDPAGAARSTQTEDGVSNYSIIMNELTAPQLHAVKKLLTTQPPQIQRLEFVNKLLENKIDDWEIMIDLRCRRFMEDLTYQRKNADGTKEKKKVMDPDLKVKVERYGHLSDCFDYALCYFLNDKFQKFKRKSANGGVITSNGNAYDDTLEW